MIGSPALLRMVIAAVCLLLQGVVGEEDISCAAVASSEGYMFTVDSSGTPAAVKEYAIRDCGNATQQVTVSLYNVEFLSLVIRNSSVASVLVYGTTVNCSVSYRQAGARRGIHVRGNTSESHTNLQVEVLNVDQNVPALLQSADGAVIFFSGVRLMGSTIVRARQTSLAAELGLVRFENVNATFGSTVEVYINNVTETPGVVVPFVPANEAALDNTARIVGIVNCNWSGSSAVVAFTDVRVQNKNAFVRMRQSILTNITVLFLRAVCTTRCWAVSSENNVITNAMVRLSKCAMAAATATAMTSQIPPAHVSIGAVRFSDDVISGMLLLVGETNLTVNVPVGFGAIAASAVGLFNCNVSGLEVYMLHSSIEYDLSLKTVSYGYGFCLVRGVLREGATYQLGVAGEFTEHVAVWVTEARLGVALMTRGQLLAAALVSPQLSVSSGVSLSSVNCSFICGGSYYTACIAMAPSPVTAAPGSSLGPVQLLFLQTRIRAEGGQLTSAVMPLVVGSDQSGHLVLGGVVVAMTNTTIISFHRAINGPPAHNSIGVGSVVAPSLGMYLANVSMAASSVSALVCNINIGALADVASVLVVVLNSSLTATTSVTASAGNIVISNVFGVQMGTAAVPRPLVEVNISQDSSLHALSAGGPIVSNVAVANVTVYQVWGMILPQCAQANLPLFSAERRRAMCANATGVCRWLTATSTCASACQPLTSAVQCNPVVSCRWIGPACTDVDLKIGPTTFIAIADSSLNASTTGSVSKGVNAICVALLSELPVSFLPDYDAFPPYETQWLNNRSVYLVVGANPSVVVSASTLASVIFNASGVVLSTGAMSRDLSSSYRSSVYMELDVCFQCSTVATAGYYYQSLFKYSIVSTGESSLVGGVDIVVYGTDGCPGRLTGVIDETQHAWMRGTQVSHRPATALCASPRVPSPPDFNFTRVGVTEHILTANITAGTQAMSDSTVAGEGASWHVFAVTSTAVQPFYELKVSVSSAPGQKTELMGGAALVLVDNITVTGANASLHLSSWTVLGCRVPVLPPTALVFGSLMALRNVSVLTGASLALTLYELNVEILDENIVYNVLDAVDFGTLSGEGTATPSLSVHVIACWTTTVGDAFRVQSRRALSSAAFTMTASSIYTVGGMGLWIDASELVNVTVALELTTLQLDLNRSVLRVASDLSLFVAPNVYLSAVNASNVSIVASRAILIVTQEFQEVAANATSCNIQIQLGRQQRYVDGGALTDAQPAASWTGLRVAIEDQSRLMALRSVWITSTPLLLLSSHGFQREVASLSHCTVAVSSSTATVSRWTAAMAQNATRRVPLQPRHIDVFASTSVEHLSITLTQSQLTTDHWDLGAGANDSAVGPTGFCVVCVGHSGWWRQGNETDDNAAWTEVVAFLRLEWSGTNMTTDTAPSRVPASQLRIGAARHLTDVVVNMSKSRAVHKTTAAISNASSLEIVSRAIESKPSGSTIFVCVLPSTSADASDAETSRVHMLVTASELRIEGQANGSAAAIRWLPLGLYNAAHINESTSQEHVAFVTSAAVVLHSSHLYAECGAPMDVYLMHFFGGLRLRDASWTITSSVLLFRPATRRSAAVAFEGAQQNTNITITVKGDAATGMNSTMATLYLHTEVECAVCLRSSTDSPLEKGTQWMQLFFFFSDAGVVDDGILIEDSSVRQLAFVVEGTTTDLRRVSLRRTNASNVHMIESWAQLGERIADSDDVWSAIRDAAAECGGGSPQQVPGDWPLVPVQTNFFPCLSLEEGSNASQVSVTLCDHVHVHAEVNFCWLLVLNATLSNVSIAARNVSVTRLLPVNASQVSLFPFNVAASTVREVTFTLQNCTVGWLSSRFLNSTLSLILTTQNSVLDFLRVSITHTVLHGSPYSFHALVSLHDSLATNLHLQLHNSLFAMSSLLVAFRTQVTNASVTLWASTRVVSGFDRLFRFAESTIHHADVRWGVAFTPSETRPPPFACSTALLPTEALSHFRNASECDVNWVSRFVASDISFLKNITWLIDSLALHVDESLFRFNNASTELDVSVAVLNSSIVVSGSVYEGYNSVARKVSIVAASTQFAFEHVAGQSHFEPALVLLSLVVGERLSVNMTDVTVLVSLRTVLCADSSHTQRVAKVFGFGATNSSIEHTMIVLQAVTFRMQQTPCIIVEAATLVALIGNPLVSHVSISVRNSLVHMEPFMAFAAAVMIVAASFVTDSRFSFDSTSFVANASEYKSATALFPTDNIVAFFAIIILGGTVNVSFSTPTYFNRCDILIAFGGDAVSRVDIHQGKYNTNNSTLRAAVVGIAAAIAQSTLISVTSGNSAVRLFSQGASLLFAFNVTMLNSSLSLHNTSGSISCAMPGPTLAPQCGAVFWSARTQVVELVEVPAGFGRGTSDQMTSILTETSQLVLLNVAVSSNVITCVFLTSILLHDNSGVMLDGVECLPSGAHAAAVDISDPCLQSPFALNRIACSFVRTEQLVLSKYSYVQVRHLLLVLTDRNGTVGVSWNAIGLDEGSRLSVSEISQQHAPGVVNRGLYWWPCRATLVVATRASSMLLSEWDVMGMSQTFVFIKFCAFSNGSRMTLRRLDVRVGHRNASQQSAANATEDDQTSSAVRMSYNEFVGQGSMLRFEDVVARATASTDQGVTATLIQFLSLQQGAEVLVVNSTFAATSENSLFVAGFNIQRSNISDAYVTITRSIMLLHASVLVVASASAATDAQGAAGIAFTKSTADRLTLNVSSTVLSTFCETLSASGVLVAIFEARRCSITLDGITFMGNSTTSASLVTLFAVDGINNDVAVTSTAVVARGFQASALLSYLGVPSSDQFLDWNIGLSSTNVTLCTKLQLPTGALTSAAAPFLFANATIGRLVVRVRGLTTVVEVVPGTRSPLFRLSWVAVGSLVSFAFCKVTVGTRIQVSDSLLLAQSDLFLTPTMVFTPAVVMLTYSNTTIGVRLVAHNVSSGGHMISFMGCDAAEVDVSVSSCNATGSVVSLTRSVVRDSSFTFQNTSCNGLDDLSSTSTDSPAALRAGNGSTLISVAVAMTSPRFLRCLPWVGWCPQPFTEAPADWIAMRESVTLVRVTASLDDAALPLSGGTVLRCYSSTSQGACTVTASTVTLSHSHFLLSGVGLVNGVTLQGSSVVLEEVTLTAFATTGSVLWQRSHLLASSQVTLSRGVVSGSALVTWAAGNLPATASIVLMCVKHTLVPTDEPQESMPWLTRLRNVPPRIVVVASRDAVGVACGAGFPDPVLISTSDTQSPSGALHTASQSAQVSATGVRTVTRQSSTLTGTGETTDTVDVTATVAHVSATVTWGLSMSGVVTPSQVTVTPSVSKSVTYCPGIVAGGAIQPHSARLYDVFVGNGENVVFHWTLLVDAGAEGGVDDVRFLSSWGVVRLLSVGANNAFTFVLVAPSTVPSFTVPDINVSVTASLGGFCSKAQGSVVLRGTVLPVPQYAKDAGQIVTLIIGGLSFTAAPGMQRAMLMMQLSVCEYSLSETVPIADSPTQLGFGSEDNRYIRGSVVGNLLIFVGLIAMSICVTVGFRVRDGDVSRLPTLRTWARHTRMPGALVLPLGLLLQPVTSNAMSLLIYPVEPTTDAVIGVSGIVASWGLAAFFTWACAGLRGTFHSLVHCKPERMQPVRRAVCGGQTLRHVSGWLASWFHAAWRWAPRHIGGRSSTGEYVIDRYGYVFEEFRPGVQWFFAIDLAGAIAAGIIGAFKPTSEARCEALNYALTALSCVLLGLNVWLRPRTSAFANTNATLNAGASVACCALLLLGDSTSSDLVSLALVAANAVLALTGFAEFALRAFSSPRARVPATKDKSLGRGDTDEDEEVELDDKSGGGAPLTSRPRRVLVVPRTVLPETAQTMLQVDVPDMAEFVVEPFREEPMAVRQRLVTAGRRPLRMPLQSGAGLVWLSRIHTAPRGVHEQHQRLRVALLECIASSRKRQKLLE